MNATIIFNVLSKSGKITGYLRLQIYLILNLTLSP